MFQVGATGIEDSLSRYYMEVSCQLQAPAALPPEERTPATQWIGGCGGWVGLGTGLDDVKKR
jgi:hypothetical protein